jgi:type IV secretion system protein TrbL
MGQASQATADAFKDSFKRGTQIAFANTGGASTKGTIPAAGGASATGGAGAGSSASSQPAWASSMRRNQSLHNAVGTTMHAVKSGDAGGAGHAVDLKESH